MKRIILLTMIFSIPFVTLAQWGGKKASKNTKSAIEDPSSMNGVKHEFMVIKGAELDVDGLDEEDRANRDGVVPGDVSLERKMKKFVKHPGRLIVAFDSGSMRGEEIQNLMRRSNEYRTMAAAVNAAARYGWEFVNANVLSTDDGIVHYYYMKRKK